MKTNIRQLAGALAPGDNRHWSIVIRPWSFLIFALPLGLGSLAHAEPFVQGAATSVYASVPDPLALSFGADGALYVGRDASGSGGGNGDAVKIHRVAPGGLPVTEFGDGAISDPDALIVDVAGTISGTPGSVLVGGVHNNGSAGKIVRIAPDGAVTTLFGPSADWWNPSGFAFDQSGRLLITEINNGKVLVTTGGAPTVLFSLAGAHHLAVDALHRIVVSTSGGTQLRLYTSTGTLSNANFATVKASSPLARGPGGAWGTDLYAVAPNGDLIRIGLDGATNKAGGGFLMNSGAAISALEFGPDGALYASDFETDRVYRMALVSVYFGEDLSPYSYPAPNDVPRPASIPNTQRAASAFASRLPGILSETFEGLATDSTPTNLVFGTNIATLTGQVEIRTVIDPAMTAGGEFPISGTNFLNLRTESPGFFTLDFSQPQAAFGFYGTDFGEPLGMDMAFLHVDGTTNTIVLPITRPQGSGGAFFFGYISQTNPFVRVAFHRMGDENDWFGFDDMTIATPDQVHPAPAVLDIAVDSGTGTTAGIGVSGTVGATYRLEYATQVPQTNWTALTNVALPTSRFLFFDTNPIPNQAKRFYRAVTVE